MILKKNNVVVLKSKKPNKPPTAVDGNYEAFFNSIDDFLFVLDEQGNIIHVNNTVIDRLGYSLKELIGKSVLMIHPSERQAEAGKIVGEMLSGKAKFCPVPIISKSGKQIPVETRIAHGFWNGQPVLFGVTKDVSQIKLSEEKFSKVFHINPLACGLSDLESQKFIEVNEAFCSLLGFTLEETLGKTASELGILDKKVRESVLLKADSGGRIINVEANLKAKNGDIKQVLLSADNVHVQDKKYRFTIVHDITEYKKNEKEREHQTKLLVGLSKATDCILSDKVLTKKNISDALQELGLVTLVDRVYIFEHIPGIKKSRGFMTQRYEWSSDNVEAQINNPALQNIPWDDAAPRWYDTFTTGGYISGNVANFPDKEREALMQQKIISLLALPIQVNSKLWGFIGFDSCYYEREWNQFEIDLLRSIANSFAIIIERMRAEESLLLKSALLEAQINSAIDGILIVDKNKKITLANKRIGEIFNVPGDILSDEDDAELLKHIVSLSKNSKVFLDKVMYLYDHELETSRDEIELKNGIILDRYSAPILDSKQNNYGRIWTFRDITENKKAENTIKEKIKELERMNEFMINRELKMVELKEEINKLKKV